MHKILLLTFLISGLCFAGNEDEKGFVDNLQDLNDQEQVEADNFIHQGINQRVFDENCIDNKISDLCQNGENAFVDDGTFTGKASAIIEKMAPLIPPALSTIMGSSPIKMETGNKVVNGTTFTKQKDGSFVAKTADPTDPTKVTKTTKTAEQLEDAKAGGSKVTDEKENLTDYCVRIPTLVETGVQAYKLLQKDSIEAQFNSTEQASRQKASLISIKQSQEMQKTASIISLGGWGGTAACYTAYIIAGATVDFKLGAKLGASILLGTFYGFKVQAHSERISAINDILKKFPKTGECNPHTETTCFCNEETSQAFDPNNFQKRCVPPPFKDRFADSPFTCVDANGKSDNECLCKLSNSCAGQRLKTGLAKVGLSPTTVAPILEGISPLDSGTAGGDINGTAKRNLANAKKLLQKKKPSNIPNFNLSPQQKKIAKEIAELGIPNFAAAAIAATPPTSSALANAQRIAATNDDFKSEALQKANRDSRLRFSNSGRDFGSKKKNKKTNSAFNPFGFGKKKNNNSDSGSDVVILDDFQRKAAAKAEINRDSGKNIFDIITYRYTVSAWKKFEETIKKEASTEEASSEEEN